ncbi:MAG: hypothetical protein ACLTBF_11030 [Christensenellales bacterium]
MFEAILYEMTMIVFRFTVHSAFERYFELAFGDMELHFLVMFVHMVLFFAVHLF